MASFEKIEQWKSSGKAAEKPQRSSRETAGSGGEVGYSGSILADRHQGVNAH
jgi:hypothetical protein